MEPYGSLAAPPTSDESHAPRDQLQLPHFRIPPLREPVPSRTLRAPSPLEPSAGSLRKSGIPGTLPGNSNPPTELPTLADFLNAARSDKLAQYAPTSLEPPPNPILPFINLRTVENLPYPFDEETPRKRARLDLQDGFGEHLHLPAPKIHKEAPKQRSFGPLAILNGLNEPPPNAALFPPIETNSAPTILTRPSRDRDEKRAPRPREDGRRHDIREIIEPITEQIGESPKVVHAEGQKTSRKGDLAIRAKTRQTPEDKSSQPSVPSNKPGTRKKQRKWTDEETFDLLRGVVRCGVGNWTAILSQPDLRFIDRTAANLKDRFRVCCPWAYASGDKGAAEAVQSRLADAASMSEADLAGKILLPDPRKPKSSILSQQGFRTPTSEGNSSISMLLQTPFVSNPPNSTAADLSNANPGKKQTSSTKGKALSEKSQSTLKSLGLQDPQTSVKSNRRPRRMFTQAEDDALLKGYNIHGFQWSLIQQDKRLNLMHRKATVLRDRFRTRFPEVYKDGGVTTISMEEKDGTPGADLAKSNKLTGTNKPVLAEEMMLKLPSANLSNPGQSSTRRSHAPPSSASRSTAAPIDPVMLPPAPPSSLPDFPRITSHSTFPFPVDEQGSGSGEGSGDMRWADNTLPPPVSDDAG